MSPLARRVRQTAFLRALARPIRMVQRRVMSPRRAAAEATLDRLQRLLCEDPVVNVAEFRGTFQLDARSHLFQRIVLEGQYEPEIAALCTRFVDPDRDAIDVGANAGFFSVLIAQQLNGKRVLAIEPSDAMALRLRSNLRRNGVAEQVEIFEGAASYQTGMVELTGVEGNEEYGTIGLLAHPAVPSEADRQVRTVSTRSLDGLVAEHDLSPGFIKVDVEGAEHLVFAGATETLATHRPVVLTEINDQLLRLNGSSACDLIDMFRGAQYRVLNPYQDLSPADLGDLETAGVLEEILCVPNELGLG